MRRALLICLAVLAAARVAAAKPPVVAGEVPLVRQDATWTYQVVSAPALAPQIGVVAASGLDVAMGRSTAPVDVLGDDFAPPPPWPYDVDEPQHARGPLAPKPAVDMRIAAMFALTTFTLGTEHSGLRVIEIRLKYEDGCVVWLNGIEVARRALDGAPRALAARPHGPEWETFYVPAAPGLLRLGDNVLAVEVHPSGRRSAPQLAADVIGRRDLGIVRGPIVADVGASTVTINVETDPSLAATLEWGAGDTLDQTLASTPGRTHSFTLSGLPAGGKVSYRVRAGAAQTPVYKVRTSPGPGDVVHIGVYGDVRSGHDVHRRIIEQMLAEPLDLVTVTGDMVLRGTDEAEWQRFFAVTRELLAQVRYLPALGNHDLGRSRVDPDVFSFAPAPAGRPDHTYWYSADVADIHLVFLDSNAYDRSEQEAWLEADLGAARGRGVRAILAFTHDGPYSRGDHRGNRIARDRYVPILARHHVDFLFSGHDHIYQRGEAGGIRYIVSGGGGAGLYKASCGSSGKPCPADGMQKVASEHHFIVLTIDREKLEMCPRRPDGRLLEKCVRYRLWRP
jgi:hypothetical protein